MQGRIAAYELNGRRLGPPRVWARKADTGPGLCITRSLGDLAAKRLGVTHVPELCSMPLTVDDRCAGLCACVCVCVCVCVRARVCVCVCAL